jgi:hypothetical protein
MIQSSASDPLWIVNRPGFLPWTSEIDLPQKNQPASGGLRGGLHLRRHFHLRTSFGPDVPLLRFNAARPISVGRIRRLGQSRRFRETHNYRWGRDVNCGSTRLLFSFILYISMLRRRNRSIVQSGPAGQSMFCGCRLKPGRLKSSENQQTGRRREPGMDLRHGAKEQRHRPANHYELFKPVNWSHLGNPLRSFAPRS